jgi:hypothetical protein
LSRSPTCSKFCGVSSSPIFSVTAPPLAVVVAGLLSIKYKGGDFKGKLKAVTGSCERGRTIRAYKKRSGPDRLIGEDTTDDRGRYKVHKSGANGKFYSKSKDKGNCQNDRSFRTIRA